MDIYWKLFELVALLGGSAATYLIIFVIRSTYLSRISRPANRWAQQALENKFWRIVAGQELPGNDAFGCFASQLKLAIDKLEQEKGSIDDNAIEMAQFNLEKTFKSLREDHENRNGRLPYCWGLGQLYPEPLPYPRDWFHWGISQGYNYELTNEMARKALLLKSDGIQAVTQKLGPMPSLGKVPRKSWPIAVRMWYQLTSPPLALELENANRALDQLRPFSGDADIAALIGRYESILKSASKQVEVGAVSELSRQADELLHNLDKAESVRTVRDAFADLAHAYQAVEEASQTTTLLK